MVSKEIIDQALANMRNRPRPFMTAKPFTHYAPMQFTEPNVYDPSQFSAQLASTAQGASTQHEQFLTGERNEQLLAIRNAKEREIERLQNQLGNVVGQAPRGADIVTGQQPNQQGQPNRNRSQTDGNRWGANNRPEVSDLRRLRPNAPIKDVNWRGREFQVNRQVAPIFRAFLNNLWRAGYKPAVIQGYNDRNIAGTNTPSLHSYGFAIDIDPAKNPVQDAGRHMQTSLPPRVAAIAAKYGLAWGGSWNSYKDPMHFSVPFRGRE